MTGLFYLWPNIGPGYGRVSVRGLAEYRSRKASFWPSIGLGIMQKWSNVGLFLISSTGNFFDSDPESQQLFYTQVCRLRPIILIIWTFVIPWKKSSVLNETEPTTYMISVYV